MTTETKTDAAPELMAALDALSDASRHLDRAGQVLEGLAHGATLEARGEVGRIARRVRNVALHAGADPAALEGAHPTRTG